MENQKQNKSFQYVLIVLLILSLIGNLFQYKNNNEDIAVRDSKIDTLTNVQAELENELSSTEKELASYRGIASNLDSLLDDANAKVAAQELKIKQLISSEKNSNALNSKLKKELAELRKLKEQYLEKANEITKLNEEKSGLQGQVATASQLQAEYIKVVSYKKKSSGKYVETSLAKRTNRIEVTLTVMDNKVAQTGDRMVYVVIKEPGGKTLAGNSMAKFISAANNEETAATASYKINYTGQKQEVKLNYENDV
ncbi:MAG: hypothetical protein H3C45_09645, partial [Bacteroidia bacterium]|nr:hypothetical protein [Bacteroidia bacterium]